MGRRRFRLADMMPNSWFYKLRDMRRPRGHAPAVGGGGGAASGMLALSSPPPQQRGIRPVARPASSPRRGSVALPHRSSYYYPTRDRELPVPAPEPKDGTVEDRQVPVLPQQKSPPTYSRRRHRVGRRLEVPAGAHVDARQSRRRDIYVGRDGSDDDEDDVEEVRRPAVVAPSNYIMTGKVIASETEIVIDLCSEVSAKRALRPIVTTRPAMREVVRYETKDRHADVADTTTPARASSASEQGSKGGHPRRPSVSVGRRLRTRVNSPRLASTSRSRKSTSSSSSKPATTPGASSLRKTTTTPAPPPTPPPLPPPLSESFAVVKSSSDPRRDFRESMEEMIAENGIRDAADLEDLLACYLALNGPEHQDLIVEVFEEIWASLAAGNDGQE